MLILADARMPREALARLAQYGELITVASQGITYQAISGHPDIFFCQTPQGLVYAPNTPATIIDKLQQKNIPLVKGHHRVGVKYPETARYNAFLNEHYFVHHPLITDDVLAENVKDKIAIPVRQGYTRCNLVEAAGLYITGDPGIKGALAQRGLTTFGISQEQIVLPGCVHGFFGGCTGIMGNQLLVCGNLDHLPESRSLATALHERGIQTVSLYPGPLWDGGSILMIQEPA